MNKRYALLVPVLTVAGFLAIKPPALGNTQPPQTAPITSNSTDTNSQLSSSDPAEGLGTDAQSQAGYPALGPQSTIDPSNPPVISRGDDDDDYDDDDEDDHDEDDEYEDDYDDHDEDDD